MSASAVFFPVNPEANSFDLVQLANDSLRAGLRLYYNGRQFALLPKPAKGWALFTARLIQDSAPCRA